MNSPLITVVLLFACVACTAQEYKTRIVDSNLHTPWEIVCGPDNNLYVSEFDGRILRVNPENGESTVLLEKPDDLLRVGEGGLMGMALSPQFLTNQFLYAAYTYGTESAIKVKVVRWRIAGNQLVERETIVDGFDGSWIHNGCRLAFDAAGKMYITMGDTGQGPKAQNLESRNGKVIRVNEDGSIPSDNPFGNAVWTLGHRNAQGLTFGPNGVLYSSEHGTSQDDEVNIIERGRNYGWPYVEGFCDKPNETNFCDSANVKEPIGIVWTPTIAPGQLIYYNGDLFPQWKNHLLLIAMKSRAVILLKLNEARNTVIEKRTILENTFGRLRAICQSPDGRVFIGSSNRDNYGDKRAGSDWIIELTPATSDVDDDHDVATFTTSSQGFSIQGADPLSPVTVYDIVGRSIFASTTDASGSTVLNLFGSVSHGAAVPNNGIVIVRYIVNNTPRVHLLHE